MPTMVGIMSYLANFADSLLEDVDNNVCENFNSIVNKQIGGKRINYSQRGSYNIRLNTAVVSHNSREYLRLSHKALTSGYSPGK